MNMSYKAPETSVLQGPDSMCWHSPPWPLKDQVAGCRTNLKDWLKDGEIRVPQLCGHILDVFFPMENLVHVPKPIHWAYLQSIFMEPDEWISLLLIKKCYSVLFLLTSNFHITLSFLISEIKKVIRERCSSDLCTLWVFSTLIWGQWEILERVPFFPPGYFIESQMYFPTKNRMICDELVSLTRILRILACI